MLKMLFLLPFADFKSISVPSASDAAMVSESVPFLALLVLILVFAYMALRRSVRPGRRRGDRNRPDRRARPSGPGRHTKPKNWIVVDGSNVMHWQDNTPQLAPLLRVVEDLKARGFAPGVVFDANAGWKLFGKYLNERDLGRMLGLPTDQVLVVPKGTQADPYILETARKFKARIVTNDRYRDWAEAHPEVAEPGHLISGAMQDGKLWLTGMGEATKQGGHA
jgi:hypothetical protein